MGMEPRRRRAKAPLRGLLYRSIRWPFAIALAVLWLGCGVLGWVVGQSIWHG